MHDCKRFRMRSYKFQQKVIVRNDSMLKPEPNYLLPLMQTIFIATQDYTSYTSPFVDTTTTTTTPATTTAGMDELTFWADT